MSDTKKPHYLSAAVITKFQEALRNVRHEMLKQAVSKAVVSEQQQRVTQAQSQAATAPPKIGEGAGPIADISVGIVGAGMAGLFSAYLLEQCGITNYKIFERTDRIGGRVDTYFFPAPYDGPEQYGDLGAMRIPKAHTRVLQLISVLGLDSKKIKYIMDNDNCLLYVNGVTDNGKPLTKAKAATIQNLQGYLQLDPRNYPTVESVPPVEGPLPSPPQPFPASVTLSLQPGVKLDKWQSIPQLYDHITKEVRDQLISLKADEFIAKYDRWDTGDYLAQQVRKYLQAELAVPMPAELISAIVMSLKDYSETTDTATGQTHDGLVEQILDEMDFQSNLTEANDSWFTLNGGLQQIPLALASTLKNQPIMKASVVELVAGVTSTGTAQRVSYHIGGKPSIEHKDFKHVIVTVPNVSLRFINISPPLSYAKHQAIRSLNYDHSTKVFCQFASPFWSLGGDGITATGEGGVSKTDLPINTVVYPSYGGDFDKGLAPLLCSYTWSNDAVLMANLTEQERVVAVQKNLLALHGGTNPDAKLPLIVQTVTKIWQEAFSLFTAGQFIDRVGYIITPENNIHFAGEHLSMHHAWIEGAMFSAVRCVIEVLQAENLFTPANQAILSQWTDESLWVN